MIKFGEQVVTFQLLSLSRETISQMAIILFFQYIYWQISYIFSLYNIQKSKGTKNPGKARLILFF